MKSKALTMAVIMALAIVGCFGAVADDSAADGEKYLTIVYNGIIDPADLAAIGGEPESADYVAELVNEPITYKDGLKFDLIKEFLHIDTFIVPVATAAGWNADQKASYLDAFEQFAGPITTEVKFELTAEGAKDKTVEIASVADFEKELALALAIVDADYTAQLAEKDAKIAEKDAAIAAKDKAIVDKDKAIKEKDDKIAALEAQISGEPVKDETSEIWMVIAILALVASVALAGFIIYQTVKTKKEAKA